MTIVLSGIRLLEHAKIKSREKWIYSADANDPSLERIAEEKEDIMQISNAGGIVLVLAHEGRFGKSKHLEHVADFLKDKTGKPVEYFSSNDDDLSEGYSKVLRPGQIVVMGNTRIHEGEETNNPQLALRFARLGEKIACGGFGKSHRENASNIGILRYLPGYLTRSQIREIKKLEKWAGAGDNDSIAVLGGVKGEKIKDGLMGFLKTYSMIIPGGIVLNTILKAKGYEIGDSVIIDKKKDFVKEVIAIMPDIDKKVILPYRVIIARKENNSFVDKETIDIQDGIPKGFMIVDFELSKRARKYLEVCVKSQGRMVMAGTPGVYTSGFRTATDPLLDYINKNTENSIVLGGDTAQEITVFGRRFNGTTSSGGGSSLYYLAHGDLPILEALRKNRIHFPSE